MNVDFCAVTLVKRQGNGSVLILFPRFAPRWAINELVCPVDKQVPMKCCWCYWSAACSWVISITPCPAQHLQQTKTLQGAELRIPLVIQCFLPPTFQCREGVWDNLAVFRAYLSKTGILEVFSAACWVICPSQLIDSCSKYPQWALMNFLLFPMSLCQSLLFPPSSRWQVEICVYNSAASVQSLIYFLHLPVKVRLNKDAKLYTGEAEELSYVAFWYFCNGASIINGRKVTTRRRLHWCSLSKCQN